MACPYEISDGFPGGFRVAFSDSFPAVFPMEFPEDIPGGFRLFFRPCRATVAKFRMADWRMELPSKRCAAGEAPLSDGGRQKLGCRGGMMEETDEI